MKKIIIAISIFLSLYVISMEKVEMKLYQYTENDTTVQLITIVSDSSMSAVLQENGRMIYDYKKDTLYLIDDSLKTSMKMSISMLGLFVTGLSDNLGVKPDSSGIKIEKSEKKYELSGKYYPQYFIYSNDNKILTIAVDENLEYPYTRKSIDKLKKIIEQIIGFDVQSGAIKDIAGLPKAIIYYKDGVEKTKTLLSGFSKGNFEKYLTVPKDYKTGY